METQVTEEHIQKEMYGAGTNDTVGGQPAHRLYFSQMVSTMVKYY